MNGEIDPNSLPITALSYKAWNKLSFLLNTNKVLPTDCPDKLPRDWRGLASLVNVSAETAAGIQNNPDKTAKILDIWVQRKDNTATIGKLYECLQRLDRFDVYDDLKELENLGQLIENRTKPPEYKQIANLEDVRDDLITFDDVEFATPQLYHAYVLYAKEDKSFVDELLTRMRSQGYKLCTEDDLLPGHPTQYSAVSKLIMERCHRIILIFSPDFLSSPANSFYTDYAQAVGIEVKKPKIIPCMYRDCTLPSNLTFYHKLFVTPPGQKPVYDFWQKLGQSLDLVNLPRITHTSPECDTSHSSLNITEYKPISNGFSSSAQTNFLALPAPHSAKSMSLTNIDSIKLPVEDTKSLSNISQLSEPAKKVGKIKRIMNKFKKQKKAIMVVN